MPLVNCDAHPQSCLISQLRNVRPYIADATFSQFPFARAGGGCMEVDELSAVACCSPLEFKLGRPLADSCI